MSAIPTGWEAVIGLEIHVQLAHADEDVLPLPEPLRRRAEHQRLRRLPGAPRDAAGAQRRGRATRRIRVGLALGCGIPERSKWDRKNYFYPDSPKAYQISQYDQPLCVGGRFHVPDPEGGFEVGIARAHLEEDAAKMIHEGGGGGRIAGSSGSVVDFNRAGTPLLEIVTEPDLRSPEQARRFLNLLRATIVAIGASDCDMEKGSLRCDANVSVRRVGHDRARHEDRAEEHELVPLPGARHRRRDRAADRRARGRRHGDPGDAALRPGDRRASRRCARRRRRTTTATSPSPTCCRVEPVARARGGAARARCRSCRRRGSSGWCATTGCPRARPSRSGLNGALTAYYEDLAGPHGRPEGRRQLGHGRALRAPQRHRPRARGLARHAGAPGRPRRARRRRHAGLVGRQAGVRRARRAARSRRRPSWSTRSAWARSPTRARSATLVDEVIAAHPDEAATYRGGKQALLGFFVGQVMKQSGGRAEPKAVQQLLRDKLGS